MSIQENGYISPEERNRRLTEQKAEQQRILKEERDRSAMLKRQRILTLVSRHSIKFLPYRTTCPKDVDYREMLTNIDTSVLIHLFDKLVEDQLIIQQILRNKCQNLDIKAARSRY